MGFCQTPAKMSYQALIRDGDGKPVTNTQVGVKISLLRGSVAGPVIYAERESPVANANGLVSFVIGEGDVLSGNFSGIDWEQGPYFIETSTDPNGGTNYTIAGTTPLLSVPYALHAKSAEKLSGTIDASQITNLGDLSGGGVDIDGNESAFDDWDKDASDDFSGAYEDLANKPWLFSGKYADLSGLPNLYDRNQVDSLVASTGSEGTVQSLRLNHQKLSITGGNSVSFENWDTDSRDDFSGVYADLKEKPELFSGSYTDLHDKPDLFEGDYNQLQNRPEIYTRPQVDSLVASTGSEGTVQSLRLNNQELSITGGNSVSFENWDTDGRDDFSGVYADLKEKPELFSGSYTDLRDKPDLFMGDYNQLQNRPEIYTRPQVDSLVASTGSEGTVQSLSLTDDNLKISGGNTVSFSEWDRNASDDFDGKYSSLRGAPEIYTKKELDSIKLEILNRLQIYFKKSEVISFNSSRNIKSSDVGNTIECTATATLIITTGMNNAMQIGDIINLEAHNGADLTVKAAAGVTINYVDGLEAKFNSDPGTVRFGLLRKRGDNEYIISGQ